VKGRKGGEGDDIGEKGKVRRGKGRKWMCRRPTSKGWGWEGEEMENEGRGRKKKRRTERRKLEEEPSP